MRERVAPADIDDPRQRIRASPRASSRCGGAGPPSYRPHPPDRTNSTSPLAPRIALIIGGNGMPVDDEARVLFSTCTASWPARMTRPSPSAMPPVSHSPARSPNHLAERAKTSSKSFWLRRLIHSTEEPKPGLTVTRDMWRGEEARKAHWESVTNHLVKRTVAEMGLDKARSSQWWLIRHQLTTAWYPQAESQSGSDDPLNSRKTRSVSCSVSASLRRLRPRCP